MNTIKKSLFTLLLLFLSTVIYSQHATIRGFVYEKESGEPIIFTNVYLYKTTHGAATDVNGYFTISKVPEGEYTLMVTSMGYDTLKKVITLKKNQILTEKLILTESVISLSGISISAERQEKQTETRTSVIKITPKQITQLPSIGGQADIAQYLQVLPGVVFTGDQGGQLYIRGGSPIQNKVMLDGMIVYNPFHSIGLFSVFDTDILRNADIYTGGFNANYGGRISSVMDLTTRNGNNSRYSGKIGANTFGSKILVEGPLFKKEGKDMSGVTFVFSAKNSYLKQSSDIFYKYINKDGLPFNYTDLYGKLSISANNGSKINVFGFNFNDNVKYPTTKYNWFNAGIGTNFVVIPGKSPMLIEGNVAYSYYNINMNEQNRPSRSSKIDGFNLGLAFTYFFAKDEIKYGVEMLGFKTTLDYFHQTRTRTNLDENTSEVAAYTIYKLTRGKFILEPGLRFHYYISLSNPSFEPRLSLKYKVSNNFRLKMASGMYSQNLISSTSEHDIVNLFYGFISGPENLQKEFNGKKVNHKLQKANHFIIGAEIDPNENLSLNVEFFYKKFTQLTNINRDKIYEDNIGYVSKPNRLKKDFIIENGDAKGFDLAIKYTLKKFNLWAVYSLSYINRFNGFEHYNPHYDRRHNINIVSSLQFGNKQQWEINGRWNFGSGFPYTLTIGYYEKIIMNDGIGSNYTTENGDFATIYGKLNSARLPNYHRFDFDIKRSFIFSKYKKLQINLSITNIYNQKNIFYKNKTTGENIYQLPILPSFGVIYSF